MTGAATRPPRVTLYGRPECHLCDEARAELAELREDGVAFELREIDIDSDDDLLRSHLERIPVVEVEGEVVSELVFDAIAVRTVLGAIGSLRA
jgi:glutathione S-transferase